MGAQFRSISEAMPAGNVTTNKNGGPDDKGRRGRNLVVPVLTLALVLIITGGLFYLGKYQPDMVKRFIGLGYLGCFVICLISNATVILPVPGILLFIPVVADFNPYDWAWWAPPEAPSARSPGTWPAAAAGALFAPGERTPAWKAG